MKADFSKLQVKMTFEGEPQEVDVRKSLGNFIHQTTGDIAMDELARRIYYSEGEVEMTPEQAQGVLAVAKQKYVVPVWQAIEQLINS